MGVPTSEFGYTSATAGRGDREVHKGHVVALGEMVIIIIIFITISFMQGIYTLIPETNPVPKEYNVTAILSLLPSHRTHTHTPKPNKPVDPQLVTSQQLQLHATHTKNG
jgi:hypothetical protein